MDNKNKKLKEKDPLYITMPTLNGEFTDTHTKVKIPKTSDVEDLREFSQEHKL